MVNFGLLSFSFELCLIPDPDSSLHELKICINIVSPLANFRLAHDDKTIFLLQKVILSIVYDILLDALKLLVNLVRNGSHGLRFEILKLVLELFQLMMAGF